MNQPQQIPEYNIASMAGDGIGTEVMPHAHAALEKIGKIYGVRFNFINALAGGAAYDATGSHFPDETKAICEAADAMLLAAIGGPTEGPGSNDPKWKGCESKFLLAIRKHFELSDNVRPVSVRPELAHLSTLKNDVVAGTDIETHRELVSGIYFGPRAKGGTKEAGDRWGSNTSYYNESQVRAAVIPALNSATLRDGRVTVVDKRNVLPETGDVWRDVALEEAEKFPGVRVNFMYVDNAAQQIIRDPKQFDVIATDNMFGDILSDATAMLPGSISMLPSASMGLGPKKLFEPVHGSAPDIAGKGIASPAAMILSAAMLLEYAFNRKKEAAALRRALDRVLQQGYRSGDLVRRNDGTKPEMILGTDAMGEKIVEAID